MNFPFGKNAKLFALATLVFAAVFSASVAVRAHQSAGGSAQSHGIVTPDGLKWGPLIPGSQMAVVSGDPSQSGPFVIRIKSVAGAVIPAHWHPTDENVTLLEGTFAVGMGDKFDATKLTTMHPGDFISMPATMHHFAKSEGSIVQVHGMGPFQVNFVNPADDPRTKQ
ncbi:MAG: cupin domain-containing protein [Candidatus Acidiferrales bacterium]